MKEYNRVIPWTVRENTGRILGTINARSDDAALKMAITEYGRADIFVEDSQFLDNSPREDYI